MKIKQIILTTGIALTVGIISIGTTITPTLADTIDAHNRGVYQKYVQDSAKLNGIWSAVRDGVYTNMFSLSSIRTTKFHVTSVNKEPLMIDTARLDNSKGTNPIEFPVPTKTHTETESLTVSAGVEISLGYEVTATAGVPGVSSMATKLTGGIKVSAGFQELTSTTTSISYGGPTAMLKANPGEIVGYDYMINRTKASGTMNTGQQITEIGPELEVWNINRYYANDNVIERSISIPGVKKGIEVYNYFKQLQQWNINENRDIAILWTPQGHKNPAIIPGGQLGAFVFIDDENKNVYTVENQRSFNAVSGTDFTAVPVKINPHTGQVQTDLMKQQIQKHLEYTK